MLSSATPALPDAAPVVTEEVTDVPQFPVVEEDSAAATAGSLKVFLCHGKEDKARVRELSARLKAHGIAPWLDEEQIMPGRNWRRTITRAVRESHAVLVCLSSVTTQKESFLQDEIKIALDVADRQSDDTVYLIPVRLDECEVPDRLRDWQWVDYFTGDGHGKLMWALQHRAKEIGVTLRSVEESLPESPAVPIVVIEPTPTSEKLPASIPSKPPLGAEWILIPAGEFIMGGEEFDREKPIHRVSLDTYHIGKYPVMVGEYLEFCKATRRKRLEAPGFNKGWNKTDHPMVNVSWADAVAYCIWLSKETGHAVTLPTEAEWEKAARGTDGREYPWGNEWDGSRCDNNVGGNSLQGTMPVGSYPTGASPYFDQRKNTG